MALKPAIYRFFSGRQVRPWALSAPIAVLLICLPMLRPLHQPDPRLVSDEEQSRLATVQAIVEQKTLAIEGTAFRSTRDKISVGPHWYSNQPPMMAVLLSGPYWVIHRLGWNFDRDPAWVAYLLTLLGVTLPVAVSAGLIYRMSRLFELRRQVRALLGLAVVSASGLISYATVLNAHASSASMLIAAAACLFYATLTPTPGGILWVGGAGLCAALAACIDPPAAVFLPLLLLMVFVLRWPVAGRIAGILLYVLAASGPVILHATLVRPITGDMKPGLFHPELAVNGEADSDESGLLPARFRNRWTWRVSRTRAAQAVFAPTAPAVSAPSLTDDDDEDPPTFWRSLGRSFARGSALFIGQHGLFSHFPILIMGLLGISMVMHRHWPATTKALAASTLIGAIAVIGVYCATRSDLHETMFANRWFIPFLPLVLFWSGAWLRKAHGPAAWSAVAVLLVFSLTVSILGATGPLPRSGFDRYTVSGAWHNLRHPPQPPPIAPVLADRTLGEEIGQ